MQKVMLQKPSCQIAAMCLFTLFLSLIIIRCGNQNISSDTLLEPVELDPKQQALNALNIRITNIFNKINLPPRLQENIYNDLRENREFLDNLLLILEGEQVHRILVDKNNSLGPVFEPNDLVDITSGNEIITNLMLTREAYDAVNEMISAAADEGHTLFVISAYRSYDHQGRTYVYWVSQEGQEEADRISARPGHSQHQLGMTVDLNMLDNELALTPEGIWLSQNASRFGWSLSYPEGFEEITGYAYESWHHRYVGKNVCLFIDKYFSSIQQYALMFIHELARDFKDISELISFILSARG
ncbi:MAG: M15 family metallopeptidase [Treponema sp.]|nr:M15 family metallopeptidase [Treponema sp.]